MSHNESDVNYKIPLVIHYLFYCILVVAGIVIFIFGYKLFYLAVQGDIEIIVESKTFKAKIINASPGLVVMLVGALSIPILAWRGVKTTVKKERILSTPEYSDDLFFWIKCHRFDRYPRSGDNHHYGDDYDSKIDNLTGGEIDRSVPNHTATIIKTKTEITLHETGPLIKMPFSDFSILNREALAEFLLSWSKLQVTKEIDHLQRPRTLIVNYGGKWEPPGFLKGGHTYEGQPTLIQLKQIIMLLSKFKQ